MTPIIPDLDLLAELQRLGASYKLRHGREPINVSHWDPSGEVLSKLRRMVAIPACQDARPYMFSYDLPTKQAALAKLGVASSQARALVGANGTTAIVSVANWLALAGVREVTIAQPSYFSVPHVLERFGVRSRGVPLERTEAGYRLPPGLALANGSALWLTSPVYNTGDYGLFSELSRIANIMNAGTIVIADETLSRVPSIFARELVGHKDFVSIYSPHKAVSVNSFKFSLVAFNEIHERAFEQWSDVLAGGLGLSAYSAVSHFLSHDYDEYSKEFYALIGDIDAWHVGLVTRHAPRATLDNQAIGHLRMVYFPDLDASLGRDYGFLSELAEASGGLAVSGARSGFPASCGLSLRINLAMDSPAFRATLARMYEFICRR